METVASLFLVLAGIYFNADIALAHKPDSITFRLHLKKGDIYTLTTITSSKSSGVIKGEPMTVDQKFTAHYLCTVDDTHSNGVTVLSFKFEDCAMDMKADRATLRIDTRDSSKTYGSTTIAKETADIEYSEAMKFIGKYFWVELSERAEGLRSNFDTVLGGKEDMDHVIHGNIEQALAGIVTFPDYPVMIGDTWRAIRGKNDEGKTSSDKADFKLMRIHGSSATLKTIFKGWGDFSDGSATGTFTGTNIIDIPSGMTTEGKYETSMKATTKIDNEDVPIDSKSILTFNITKQ